MNLTIHFLYFMNDFLAIFLFLFFDYIVPTVSLSKNALPH